MRGPSFSALPVLLWGLMAFSHPTLAQGPASGLPAVAPLDTALVEIILPQGTPPCQGVAADADTVVFGRPEGLSVTLAQEGYSLADKELKTSEEWLQLKQTSSGLEFRAYRLAPFRIRVGQALSSVLVVQPVTAAESQVAPIRLPRSLGLRWWLLLALAAGGLLLIIGMGWLWQRRQRLEPLQQWAPADPAWYSFAIGLRELMESSPVQQETTRPFLDQLAALGRQYLAGRFLVSAGEMTSREILATCRAKGHPERTLRPMTALLEQWDHQRYNPEAADALWCREQAADFFRAVARCRIIPRYTRVRSSLLLEGEKAWAWLARPENLDWTEDSRPGAETGEKD